MQKLRIAVCEDEKTQMDYLCRKLEKYEAENEVRLDIDCYFSAEQLLFEKEDRAQYDIFILDIQLKKMNGMELAKKLRSTDKDAYIVFLTGLKEYALEGYEVGAVRYLLKPLKEGYLFAALDEICEQENGRQTTYLILENAGKKILCRDILYVEADGHYRSFVQEKKTDQCKASLNSMAKELAEKGFALLRRGLYVNLYHVERIGRQECTLDDGSSLPVSRGCYQNLNQSFIRYYKTERH